MNGKIEQFLKRAHVFYQTKEGISEEDKKIFAYLFPNFAKKIKPLEEKS
jgi:hypothetical protein